MSREWLDAMMEIRRRRDAAIVEAYRRGTTRKVIAADFELTYSRIRQILRKAQEPGLT